ncbi:MAG TPA: GNAT family N-acetyltransferase [Vicinamibacteria bacterium]|nr:GNAT family N-acetyltransferase [Vicinamibacteria bacterium]
MELSAAQEFRTAGPPDVAAIVALVNDAYQVEASFLRGPRTDEEEIASLLDTGGFLLAEGPVGLEGCIYVEPRGSVGYFGLLSVATIRQGRGLGRRLIAAAEAGLRGARCQIVEILVVNLRKDLFPFYAALGYAASGAAPFPESEESRLLHPVHFVVMRKAL